MSYRAVLNLIKQKYHLQLEYTDTVHGPSQAHVWCGEWILNGNQTIGTGESSTRAGAKEDSARPAVETLIAYGYLPPRQRRRGSYKL